jgi:putative transposase
VLEHDRRKVLHFTVTEHPTGAWTAQQIVQAFARLVAAQYSSAIATAGTVLRFDRESSRWHAADSDCAQSPWQNPDAERLIGSIRRECLNHDIILNARHLKRTLSSYFCYCHESRTHLNVSKQCPFPREVLKAGKIVATPQLGSLHHRYERIAAQQLCSGSIIGEQQATFGVSSNA